MLTFRKKREALLEWFDENARPLAFLDDDEVLGIEVGSHATRLLVDERSLVLQVGSPAASVALLEHAVQGVFDVLAPKETTALDYHGLWTVGLDGTYADLTSKLAARAAPIHRDGTSGFEVMDGALLIDLKDEFGTYQVEFGIVTPGEIRQRVGREVAGRVTRASRMLMPVESIPADVAVASLYMDVHVRDAQQADLETAGEVTAHFDATEKRVTRLAYDLAGTL